MKLKISPSVWSFRSCLTVCFFLILRTPAELARCAEAPKAEIASAPSGAVTTPLQHAVIRQGARGEILLTEHSRRLVFVKSKEMESKSLLSKVPISRIGSTLLTLEMGPEARALTPYVGTGMAKAAHIGRGILSGRGSAQQEFEFDVLPGPTAGVTIYEGELEILVPLNAYLPSAEDKLDEVQPVLLKLAESEKDQCRVLSTRSVAVKEDRKGRFALKETTERREGEREEVSIPMKFSWLPGKVIQAISSQPLTTGEYALIFRTKAVSGQDLEDVVLRSPSAPASLKMDGRKPVQLQSGELLGFDFRVIPAVREPS
ncbi:MAG: hypothetical protein JO356_02520 [Acidobacteria bacterium]|nr:hypothetical protein [Acidobacteriota bacterium]